MAGRVVNLASVGVVAMVIIAVSVGSVCVSGVALDQIPNSMVQKGGKSALMNTNIALVNADPKNTDSTSYYNVVVDTKSMLDQVALKRKLEDIEEDEDDPFITKTSGKLKPTQMRGPEAEEWADEKTTYGARLANAAAAAAKPAPVLAASAGKKRVKRCNNNDNDGNANRARRGVRGAGGSNSTGNGSGSGGWGRRGGWGRGGRNSRRNGGDGRAQGRMRNMQYTIPAEGQQYANNGALLQQLQLQQQQQPILIQTVTPANANGPQTQQLVSNLPAAGQAVSYQVVQAASPQSPARTIFVQQPAGQTIALQQPTMVVARQQPVAVQQQQVQGTVQPVTIVPSVAAQQQQQQPTLTVMKQ